MSRILITSALFLSILFPVLAQDDISQFNYWQYYSDIENSLYKHFYSVAHDQLESRKIEVGSLITRTDWLDRQSLVRKKLSQIIGQFPDKTSLNAQITGISQQDGYRIEKTIYESIPGYYVTGALYIPDGMTEKAPAIFYACGHSVDGFRVNIYQHIIVNLVKKGFIVFTIDPMGQGERYEYWDQQKEKPRFPIPDHEHSYAGAQCLISGYSTAKYFIWDVIRGIDYLLTREEIDPDRIGMTGRSGGGNITAYLGALDDRILATAPECYITSYEYIYKSIGPQCAEQNLYKMIGEGLDHADFIEARAPKPTMIIGTTRDIFSIQGTRESYMEAKRIYDALDAEEKLILMEDDTVHASTKKTREAMYAFFQKYLENPGSPEDLQVKVPGPEELQITQSGQTVTSFNGQSVFSLNSAVVRRQMESLELSRDDHSRHIETIVSRAIRYSAFDYPDHFGDPVFSGRYVHPAYTLEKYLVPGSGDYVLPAVLLLPAEQSKKEIILILDTEGMEHAVNQDSLAHALVREGYSVLLADLPGIGSMGPGYLKGDSYIDSTSYNQWFAAVLAGKTNVGLRAEDIVRVVHFIKYGLKEYSGISALAIGPLGSELLHAAVFEPDIKNICLIRPFISYTDIATTRLYNPRYIPFTVPGAIGEYDLPDLIAGLCPRKVLIIEPLSGDGMIAVEAKVKRSMRFPLSIYSEKGVPGNFNLVTDVDGLFESSIINLIHW
ncbi:MAG: xylan esterase [Bacteroidia bacterium]|nr:MAG: xylan esterase [Bacteroidia bacterium]